VGKLGKGAKAQFPENSERSTKDGGGRGRVIGGGTRTRATSERREPTWQRRTSEQKREKRVFCPALTLPTRQTDGRYSFPVVRAALCLPILPPPPPSSTSHLFRPSASLLSPGSDSDIALPSSLSFFPAFQPSFLPSFLNSIPSLNSFLFLPHLVYCQGSNCLRLIFLCISLSLALADLSALHTFSCLAFSSPSPAR